MVCWVRLASKRTSQLRVDEVTTFDEFRRSLVELANKLVDSRSRPLREFFQDVGRRVTWNFDTRLDKPVLCVPIHVQRPPYRVSILQCDVHVPLKDIRRA